MAARAAQARICSPFFLEPGDNIISQPFRVQAALAPAGIEPNANVTVISQMGWNEPDPGIGIRPVLVVEKEGVIGVGEHENRAGVSWHKPETEQNVTGSNRKSNCPGRTIPPSLHLSRLEQSFFGAAREFE